MGVTNRVVENSDVTAAGLGSFTVLPMVLLLNPGRANGGPLARAYPFFRLFGIDTVTPETEGLTPAAGTRSRLAISTMGLALHGADLIPIKLDVGDSPLPAVGSRGLAESRYILRIMVQRCCSRHTSFADLI